MKKTKVDQRFEQALNAFFEAGEEHQPTGIICAHSAALAENFQNQTFSQKADGWISSLKKVFLFLPGVLLLHLACFASVFFYKDFGLNFQMLFFFAAGIFMVWAGFGDLKNKKHFLLPLAVILSILPFAFLLSFLSISFIDYSFYLFPVSFVSALLVKGWLDKTEKTQL